MKDDDHIEELQRKVGTEVNVELIDRVDKLERDVQTLLVAMTLLSFTLFFITRELYAMPTGVQT